MENITKKIRIPEWEIEFRADRASGPGGQNVNKTATKVTLKFDVKASKTLNDEEKKKVVEKLSNYINKEGEVVIYEQSSRSQWTNRVNVIRRLNEMINDVLIPEKERKATKISASKKEKRLTEKKKHSEIKRNRSKIDLD